MTNHEKLIEVFSQSFGLPADETICGLEYNSIQEWDSVSHMILIAGIDSAFDVMLETDDVINLSSFTKAVEILRKYGVDFRTA